MKEFLKNKTITYNLMSFTGFKALVLFALLLESPKSYVEISEHFKHHPYLKESISIDTLRVYINSLRRIGCEIERIRVNKVSKYYIKSTPFELEITQEQINSISKIYKSLIKNIDIRELMQLEKFLKKIANYASNENFKETINKISTFKDMNMELIDSLIECCEHKEQIVISYNSPHSGVKDIEILTDKIDLANNKLYLYGTGFEYKQYGYFPVNRILAVKEIKKDKTILNDIKESIVGYELNCNIQNILLENNEKIISYDNNKVQIEITSSSDFMIRQRLLSLGADCKILYPKDFRDDFLSLLQEMKAGYDND